MDEDKTGFFAPGPLSRPDNDSENAHYLLVISGSERGRSLELGSQAITIGRHPECELCLPDSCVSRRHCTITLQHPLVWVDDLGSSNGTYLNERKIGSKSIWPQDGLLRVGNHLLKHEYRHKQSVQESETLAADLKKASEYIQSLLPAPIIEGPVRTDWCFVPSAVLGGDSFGYYWLDHDRFVFYLVDVCGHGVGPAMHAVSVLNVLRHRSLSKVDFGQPAEALNAVNGALGMDEHGDMFFSIWYGVYRVSDRTLTFASGGHPPAILLSPGAPTQDLTTGGLFAGVMLEAEFQQQSMILPPDSVLWLFSDGVFEITLENGVDWSLGEFRDLLGEQQGVNALSPKGLYRDILSMAKNGKIDDDFSLVALRFL